MGNTLPAEEVLSLLEQFESPFLLLNAQFSPLLASVGAASLLELRDREHLEGYENSVTRLAAFCKDSLKRSAALFRLRNALGSEAVGETHELELETESGRRIQVLTYCRQLRTIESWPDGPSSIVLFQDLTYLQPFLASIRQSRRNRALTVMLSSFLGKRLSFVETGDFLELYRSAEKDFFSSTSHGLSHASGTDLIRDSSLAVDIVDPLVSNSSKIRLDIETSALLSIPRVDFLRLMSHLLLEATDFGGPFATTRIQAKLVHSSVFKSSMVDAAEITLRCDREVEIPRHLSPLELYVYRTYVPNQYRVKTSKRDKGKRDTTGTVSEQLYSENLTISSELALRHQVELDISREESHQLRIKLRCPLAHV